MNDDTRPINKLVHSLQERAKELDCLYKVEEVLSDPDVPFDELFLKLVQVIPSGWQFPDLCRVRLAIEDRTHQSPDYDETPWTLTADVTIDARVVGTVNVSYTESPPVKNRKRPFLKEEEKLIQIIAVCLSRFLNQKKLKQMASDLKPARKKGRKKSAGGWQVVMEMVKQFDRNLYLNISRKMLNHLCWSGINEAEEVLSVFGMCEKDTEAEEKLKDWNVPLQRKGLGLEADFTLVSFSIASKHLGDQEILDLIQGWIQEDKLSFLSRVVNRHLPLSEVVDAIQRYHQLALDEGEIHPANKLGIAVALIRRFLGDNLEFLNVAQKFIEPRDFYQLQQKVIYSAESHGKLGGKSAGLYLAAQILKKKSKDDELLANIKIPKTWYITSDVVLQFMHHNGFDEVVEQKYKDIRQIKLEYPHIVQQFKSGRFPADIVNGLSVALDDFGDTPIIVRSSSLLEDRMGAAFSGKYKSLFLPNQGSKKKRLDALMDAIAEVYASTFSPDPIEYRVERGLIDYGEEMGVMLQEVVGTRMGNYFVPSYAGVGFSKNEFRWSPRIRREDGLLRIVPGMGTRAVDRLSDDYPVLIAPGQPGLRANVSLDEILRYSPRKIDVIDMEKNSFETLELDDFFKEVEYELPGINTMVSIFRDGHLERPMGLDLDPGENKLVVTMEGLVAGTRFVKRMRTMLETLEDTLGTPVDIEFASDGKDFYLLQCRPQSYSVQDKPAVIPTDIPKDQILFTADRYISNGTVSPISHIVYVDPRHYAELESQDSMIAVGRVVSKLNKLLPKHRFTLMGPGRWGSRGDIKLGVNVTYSDINNTALLVEIAMKKGKYLPDLSFGTHFFQDLVESNIRYLPLYPDDDGVQFNESFFTESPNELLNFLPEYKFLENTVRVIDVPANNKGKVLQLLMNSDQDEAVGMLNYHGFGERDHGQPASAAIVRPDKFTAWRREMADRFAERLDADRFGVEAVYVLEGSGQGSSGSGPGIDLLIHFQGSGAQRKDLLLWLDGWNHGLGEMSRDVTGYRIDKLINARLVTDEDITAKKGYAARIGAMEHPAIPLTVKKG